MQFFSGEWDEATRVLLSLSVILFAGFMMTRLTKLIKLPNVSGFIFAGVLIGPEVLNLIPAELVGKMGFVSDLALACIAFGVGQFFKRKVLRAMGARVLIITVAESVTAGAFVTIAMRFIFGFAWNFSLLLGAIATATAPASTMMTIRQYRAQGHFVDLLLQVVALDDVVCLLLFSVAAATVGGSSKTGAIDLLLPCVYNLLALIVGGLCGFGLARLLKPATRSRDNRLILTIAMLTGLAGLCTLFNVSPLLSCMAFGTIYANRTDDQDLFKQLNDFTPPVMSLFFIISGMSLDIGDLGVIGLAGAGYFVIRILGKYLGSYWGCAVTGQEKSVQRYLGLAMIPQAGVSIGLAFLGQRILSNEMGDMLLSMILASSVLYELIGPGCAKAALMLSGSIASKNPTSATGAESKSVGTKETAGLPPILKHEVK